MALTAGALSKVLIGQSTAQLSSTAASGGTGPYTEQLYASTVSGFTPGPGTLVAGATGLGPLVASGLIPGTLYYFIMVYTDTGAGNATVNSAQLSVQMESAPSQNQFALQPLVGVVDLRVGPTNVISAQVDPSQVGAIQPGQAVKLVPNTFGGVPRVVAVSAKTDVVYGVVVFNFKDIQYLAGQNLEVALGGTVIWQWATGAITQGLQVCLDQTYVGGVQATGATATIMGYAVDGAAAAGPIRVNLQTNVTGATA